MAKFSFFIFLVVFLNASIINDYKNKKYEKICTFETLNKYIKNEKVLPLIGEACLKIGHLYMLPYVINHLQATSIGRKNAIYFLVIYNEKRLLYSFLFDNFDISDFSFPETDYFLSKVFEAVKNKKYKKKGKIYIIDSHTKMYKKNNKLVIELNNKRYYFK